MQQEKAMTTTLINIFTVDPANQAALIALLRQNIDGVIKTLPGWRATEMIAALDGTAVAIHSEWASPEAVEAMRTHQDMVAYFPKIGALASYASVIGHSVLHDRAAP
jgi:quinol monooxygenase YgiN